MHPLNGALPGPNMSVRVTRGALVALGILMYRLAAELCSIAGTILLTPYSMVWDWGVSRVGPMLLYWP